MMHDFLSNNRIELVERCRAKVAERPAQAATVQQLQTGVPLFLDQLIRTLRIEQAAQPMESRKISEFRTLNRCLDNAIAEAVTEFSYQRDFAVADKQAVEMNERLGFLAHELRNFLGTATLAFTAAKVGNFNLAGATGSVLERSLVGLRNVIDRTLAEVRITAGPAVQQRVFSAAQFVTEVRHSAALEAEIHGCIFTVSPVDALLAIQGDWDLLFSAVGNLLQNAFKFTHPHTQVTLNVYAVADRILIDVKDNCGGLPPGTAESMFLPFVQMSGDRSGLGLGLSIARRSIEANDGELTVRDVPRVGCIFTISLPRRAML